MNFGFNEEQELLRNTARKFFENECGSETVRRLMETPEGISAELWKKLAEQGWLGLIYPEQYDGTGLGLVDLVVLMEEMGRAGVTLTAVKRGETFTLSGTKLFVHDAHTADALVVAARTRPGAGADGVSLFLLPKRTRGLEVTLLPTMDQTRKLCEVALSDLTIGPDALLGAAG